MGCARKLSEGTRPWKLAVLAVFSVLLLWCAPALAQEKAVKREQAPAVMVSAGDIGSDTGDLYCLVVGVSNYANPGIPKLGLAVKDAQDFAAFVKSQGKYLKNIHVKELLDKDASRVNILRYLSYDLRNVGTNDTVILYFSGHGSIDTKYAGDYFFLSHDADPEFPVITAVQLNRDMLLSRIKAKRVMVVLDACHSGTPAMHRNVQTRSTGESLKGFLEQFKESQGQVIITSSSPNEYAMEYPDLPNGVFTHFLLDGLKGRADKDKNGIVSAQEAYQYAYEQTKKRTQGGQHPVWSGDMSGTFPLALLKSPGGTLEIVTDPPEVTISRKEGTKFETLGKTDQSGRITVTDLALGKPLFFKFAKEGWESIIPDPIIFSPDQREIKGYQVKLNPLRAHLTIKTNVPGVMVRLDDASLGQTGDDGFMFVENIQVSVPHELVLTKDDYREKKIGLVIPSSYEGKVFRWEGKLDLIPEKKQELKYVDVSVSTEPAEVDVYMGDAPEPSGRTDGHGNLKLRLKGPGNVVLRFRKPGHALETREVSLPRTGSFLVSKVKLRQIEPTLKLFVDQPGAKVFIKRVMDKAIKREDPDAGYKDEGETDANGHMTIKNLPMGVPVMVKIKKAGCKDKILGPFVFSEDNWLMSPPVVALESALPKPEALPQPPAQLTSTDLLINTDPADVSVTINGEYKGDTDKNGELKVKVAHIDKPVKMTFSKYGYVAVEKTLTLPAVASTRMDRVVMNRLVTRMEVSVGEPFADILVKHGADFEVAGKTDSLGKATLEDLPLNKNVFIKIKKDGWRDKALGPVRLTEKQPHLKLPDVKLEPALAIVKIRTEPQGVHVKVNGAQKKSVSGSLITLTDVQVLSDLDVEISKEGYQTKHLYLHVPAQYEGKTFYTDPVQLDRSYAKLELRTEPAGVTVKVDGIVVNKTDKAGKVLVEKVPVGTTLTIEFEKEGFVKKSIKETVPVDYEGGVFQRREVVFLETEQKPTRQTVRPAPQEKPSSERWNGEQSYQRAPRDTGSWGREGSGSRQESAPSTGPAHFPADFTN